MREENPSIRLHLSSEGYYWLKFLESKLKTKKAFPESILNIMKSKLHGQWISVTKKDIDHIFNQIEKGSLYRLKSEDLDCIFWQRTQTKFFVVRVLHKKTVLLNNYQVYW
jgi:hypothetical protein